MFWKHVLIALATALGLSAVFIAGFRKRGPWDNYLLFFAVVFLGSWAGGIWFTPLGPPWGGVYWLPFLIVGLIFALLLAAVASPFPPDTTVQLLAPGETSPEKRKQIVLGVYFWLLIFALVVLIVTRYF
jgi:hypothetical protein